MPLLYIPLSCLFLWDNKLWPLFHFKRFIFSTEVEGTYKVLIFTLYTKTVIQKTFPHFSCSSLSCRQCQVCVKVSERRRAEVNRLCYILSIVRIQQQLNVSCADFILWWSIFSTVFMNILFYFYELVDTKGFCQDNLSSPVKTQFFTLFFLPFCFTEEIKWQLSGEKKVWYSVALVVEMNLRKKKNFFHLVSHFGKRVLLRTIKKKKKKIRKLGKKS